MSRASGVLERLNSLYVNETAANIMYITMLANEDYSSADEGLIDSSKAVLAKLGLHASKSTGLIEYLFKSGKGLGLLIKAAVLGDKAKIKEVAKSIKKEEVIDFLLKLDQATLHAVTGPVHLIDAITGWHLGVAISHKVTGAVDVIKFSITKIKSVINNIEDKVLHKKIVASVSRLEKIVA